MNSMRRGAPVPTAPVLMMLVMRSEAPAHRRRIAPVSEPMLPDGVLKTG